MSPRGNVCLHFFSKVLFAVLFSFAVKTPETIRLQYQGPPAGFSNHSSQRIASLHWNWLVRHDWRRLVCFAATSHDFMWPLTCEAESRQDGSVSRRNDESDPSLVIWWWSSVWESVIGPLKPCPPKPFPPASVHHTKQLKLVQLQFCLYLVGIWTDS